MKISKSKFMAGVQCLKRLYLEVHEPELAIQPDATDEAIIEQGREVGMLAQQMFPGGIEVDCSKGLDAAIRRTRELVANSEVPAIFEGTFEYKNVLVRVDVLQRRRDGRWRLVEVKSTTDVKEHHLQDIAIQNRVVSGCGVELASTCLAHVNRNYVREGPIDPRRFFKIRNLTHRFKRLKPALVSQLRSQFRVLAMPTAPDLASGPQCTTPVVCEFFDYCNPPKPNNHISYLPRLHASAMEELEEMGIETIQDIPDDFELSEIQRRACTSVKTGSLWFSPDLKTQLESLKYPLCFMDFETVNPAIPKFDGMSPYSHLCFQWSVHRVTRPGAEPEHFEFLAMDGADPRAAFLSSLCEALGERGSIVVYNQKFEEQRICELAEWLPDYANRVEEIKARLWDLLPAMRNYVYHPAFAGSFSLKAVLPALVPGLTYEGMEVSNGQAAGLAWRSLIQVGLDDVQREKIKNGLLAYCSQDTLGLHRIVEALALRARN